MTNKILIFFLLLISVSVKATPDTLTNRIATAADAEFWPSVNEGDFIFFKGNADNNKSIYAGSNVIKVTLPLGKKILIWRGDYIRIFIEGTFCESTAEQPTIVTNLGGQVKWGYSELKNSKRTLELAGFKHLLLTGKYDENLKTGDSEFLGHNAGEDMAKDGYYKRYGLWGNPKWSGYRFNNSFSNIVRISGFNTCKVSYVAATEGGFAGFNIKSDNPPDPERVEVDIQDCFAGWTESEGVYISYSTSAANQDLTKLILRNNIFAFTGSEAIQSDNLIEGSIIENNVVFVASCFHRRPFQDKYQDGLHQFSFVEGGISVQNNIMLTGSYLHHIRYKDPGAGRAFPHADKKVVFKNNYYGYARSNISYVWNGDGITKYLLEGNVYGPVSTPSTSDAYTSPGTWDGYFKLCNSNTDITFQNNIYPKGRALYDEACGKAIVTEIENKEEEAPLLQFVNSGWDSTVDYRNFTFWSSKYTTSDKKDQFIPYKIGDYVFYFDDNGNTNFYKCIAAHAADYNPNSSPAYWTKMEWHGSSNPPLDVRLLKDSYYEKSGKGLTYTNSNTLAVDNSAPLPDTPHGFSVFPNPVNEKFTINSEIHSTYKLQLYSVQSQEILQKQVSNSGSKQIDISSLESGVYIIRINVDSNKSIWFKIIKK